MTGHARALFIVTILVGSFLLFLVQPLVARMALPLLGGAPAVWNSAMLVYQALLLGGYAYAHGLSRLTLRRQATIHIALLLLAGLTLPITLAQLPAPAAGWEAVWVPALFLATVGPVFFVVSAQAPLMQRWFAADRAAGDPYWLYSASNLGSFAGLVSYPFLLEPYLPIAGQTKFWAVGYGLLALLVILAARARWNAGDGLVDPAETETGPEREPIGMRRILLWLALAAVPSGLMLSTTTHLTTDIVAMPLLWVLPLGLYLLSFSFAFADQSAFADACTRLAPLALLLAGSIAMVSGGHASIGLLFGALALLLIAATALHRRLYLLRPDASQLTLFYLVMSAGGALGGLFTALIAPLAFDWAWEHPILLLAAAALLPLSRLIAWPQRRIGARTSLIATLAIAAALVAALYLASASENHPVVIATTFGLALCGILALPTRWAFLLIFAGLMVARGGWQTLETSASGLRERSYFGIYTRDDDPEEQTRSLLHGTTVHGMQFTDPLRRRNATTYYGPEAGVGLVLTGLPLRLANTARIGAVGLGTGTLACYARPGQRWTFFEIDPVVARYSKDGTFTFLRDCTPDAAMRIGDARLVLQQEPAQSFDVLVIDAFSSDSIPLHLVTREAFDIYDRALAPGGIIVLHISNRFIDLRPVIAAHAQERGWPARLRMDPGNPVRSLTGSIWVALSREQATLDGVAAASGDAQWTALPAPTGKVWTDDHASILPHIMWERMTGTMP